MLGRLRRTTRTDVGLALGFVGIAYLVWALVAGISRAAVRQLIHSNSDLDSLPRMAKLVKAMFVDGGFVIDLLGVVWLTISLFLLAYSSRQKFSISWVWVSAVGQLCVAALGAVFVLTVVYDPFTPIAASASNGTAFEQVSSISLAVLIPIALAIWVTFLVWLLVERARFGRLGPTLHDGLRSNIYR